MSQDRLQFSPVDYSDRRESAQAAEWGRVQIAIDQHIEAGRIFGGYRWCPGEDVPHDVRIVFGPETDGKEKYVLTFSPQLGEVGMQPGIFDSMSSNTIETLRFLPLANRLRDELKLDMYALDLLEMVARWYETHQLPGHEAVEQAVYGRPWGWPKLSRSDQWQLVQSEVLRRRGGEHGFEQVVGGGYRKRPVDSSTSVAMMVDPFGKGDQYWLKLYSGNGVISFDQHKNALFKPDSASPLHVSYIILESLRDQCDGWRIKNVVGSDVIQSVDTGLFRLPSPTQAVFDVSGDIARFIRGFEPEFQAEEEG